VGNGVDKYWKSAEVVCSKSPIYRSSRQGATQTKKV